MNQLFPNNNSVLCYFSDMYHCLKQQVFEDATGYRLVPLAEQDMEAIRQWRNAQIEVLRQMTPLTPEEQQVYFHKVLKPTFAKSAPPQILFTLWLQKQLIGYGGLTHIDWDAGTSEVSFLLDPSRIVDLQQYESDFAHFLQLLLQVAFVDIQLKRLYTETFAFRDKHMEVLEKCGFKREGILPKRVYKRGQWFDSILHGIST